LGIATGKSAGNNGFASNHFGGPILHDEPPMKTRPSCWAAGSSPPFHSGRLGRHRLAEI